MTESVGNETIEKYWCFLSGNWHWRDFLTWDEIENTFGYVSYMYLLLQKWIVHGKFQICHISLLPTDAVILDHTVLDFPF
jgi:hypothetical protein